MTEHALQFDCAGDTLLGILHRPDNEAHIGVIVIVGGPQYRVGSHRQFVLLSRYLAAQNMAVLRFDYRGIGDSHGESRDFLTIDEDICCAIDAICQECPTLNDIYLWGLCDAASAALLYAHRDARVKGLVLANPWVRTEAGYAKTLLTDYYFKKLTSIHFWQTALKGQLNIWQSLNSLKDTVFSTFRKRGDTVAAKLPHTDITQTQLSATPEKNFPDYMLAGIKRFSGRVMIIISGEDLTAAEFLNFVKSTNDWKKALQEKCIEWKKLPASNHTFSTREWRDQVATWTCEWIQKK